MTWAPRTRGPAFANLSHVARRWSLLLLLLAAALGCTSRSADPKLISVTPPEGPDNEEVRIEIEASGLRLDFEVDYRKRSNSALDPELRVLLDDLEVASPRLIAPGRIEATVPAGLGVGLYRVTARVGAAGPVSREGAYRVHAGCGDGVVNGTEVCDDGNTQSADGCSADCSAFEPDFRCSGDAPTTCDPINDPPIAGDLLLEIGPDLPVSIELPASDPDGDPLSFRIIAGPQVGELSAPSGSGLTVGYQPPPSRLFPFGRARFVYVVSDGELESGEGSVQIVIRPAWWDIEWTERRAIIVRPMTGSFADFAVRVRLDPTRIDYTATSSGGRDLRFLAEDQTTVLPHEIETWDPTGVSEVWVSIPRAETRAQIWMYYGNPAAADRQQPEAVWNPAHGGVWHLGADARDSTAGASHGTEIGTRATAAVIGAGRELDGNGWVELPTGLLSTGAGTLLLWARSPADGYAYADHAFAFYATATQDPNADGLGDASEIHLGFDPEPNGTSHYFFIEGDPNVTDDVRIRSPAIANDGAWHSLIATWDRTTGLAELYVDGAFQGRDDHKAYVFRSSTRMRLGRPVAGVRTFIGDLDELRVLDRKSVV